MLKHFLEFPDPNGFKAQLVAVDRKACALYKKRLDEKLAERGLPAGWSDVIISSAQNSEPEIAQFEYEKSKQDDLGGDEGDQDVRGQRLDVVEGFLGQDVEHAHGRDR